MGAAVQGNSSDGGGSGDARLPEPRYLAVGRVLRPHGVRGELRVEVLTGYPERLQEHRRFYLASPNAPGVGRHYPVERLRLRGDVMLLKLGGCDDRNAAEGMRGLLVQVPVGEAVPLEEGEYYHFQLVGLRVETEQGELLGRVVEILETKANDVYVVHGPRGELLLPALEDVILELDPTAGRIVVHLLPGLVE